MLELKSGALRVTLSALGARLVSVLHDGVDLLAGGADEAQIMAGDWTTGILCGRFAGRITSARFALDGAEHRLAPNMGPHQLHGGPDNFGIRRWTAEQGGGDVRFSLVSPDGDQGFPGELAVKATYSVNGSILRLGIEARTTKPTIVNLTNHAYWNLAGGGPALGHEMQIHGGHYLPLSDLLLPLGAIEPVAGTRWDFRALRPVAEPYDNCWLLDGARGEMKPGLTLRDPASGRRMDVWTSECAMQMYTANHWDGVMPGRDGPLQRYGAIAIEPQNAPDAPTHANFPSAVLRPGEAYRNRIEWRFSRS